MVALANFFNWRDALVIVKPETFVGWHRTAFKLFWRWKSRKRVRPALPKDLRELVRRMARENPASGQERIARALLLKFGAPASPEPLVSTWSVTNHRESPGSGGQPFFGI